jgi:hypothetical protein
VPDLTVPADYWNSYERRVSSLSEVIDAVRTVSAYEAATGTRFVWRGVTAADWALHSSLFRFCSKRDGRVPTEKVLRRAEANILDEAREWGLDWHSSGGRLTPLELLAALQHFRVPTRLVDFTSNPMIGLWFAVQNRDGQDGRLFAIDISNRVVSREDAIMPNPWWFDIDDGVATVWATESWAWRPPPLEARIVRQDSWFLMGGVPSTVPRRNKRVSSGGWTSLTADEVRECMSLPFRLVTYERAAAALQGRSTPGQPSKTRAFTLRVTHKRRLRGDLEQAFGYTHRSLFPDWAGFSAFGRSFR